MAEHGRRNAQVVLRAQELAKSYGTHEALTGITFELRAGEILGLLGPNGAGKTTAIRILSTILPASGGHFTVLSIPDSRPQEIRALIGAAPENTGFPAAMTGVEFLVYMGRLYRRSRSQAQAKATDLLHLFGLDEVRGKRIATYSRGMKQRLAIARSLINDPKVLFLDEPTLGFDPKGQQEMLQAVREAAEVNHVAVILSSHLLEVVEGICHSLLILNRGRVIAKGSVADIKRHVAGPLVCHIQTKSEAVPKALAALSTMAGVTVERDANQVGGLVISIQSTPDDIEMNAVLRRLIQADVPIEAFTRESMRLSDAFLSMTEHPQA